MLTYTVEANVGGKIAQVGSRLIDMTAKKMADIFFGKFSELISKEKVVEKFDKKSDENKFSNEIKSKKRILIYLSITVLAALAIYLIV